MPDLRREKRFYMLHNRFVLGKKSKEVLKNLHPFWGLIIPEVLRLVDISLIEGLRGSTTQTQYLSTGKTKLPWPLSRHNRTLDPSLKSFEYTVSDAVDLIPYPSGYGDMDRMVEVAQIVLYVAKQKGIKVRWGGDWHGNGKINNGPNDFFDPWHFELVFD